MIVKRLQEENVTSGKVPCHCGTRAGHFEMTFLDVTHGSKQAVSFNRDTDMASNWSRAVDLQAGIAESDAIAMDYIALPSSVSKGIFTCANELKSGDEIAPGPSTSSPSVPHHEGLRREPSPGVAYPPVIIRPARKDENGIVWSAEIAPFFAENPDARLRSVIRELYNMAQEPPKCITPPTLLSFQH